MSIILIRVKGNFSLHKGVKECHWSSRSNKNPGNNKVILKIKNAIAKCLLGDKTAINKSRLL